MIIIVCHSCNSFFLLFHITCKTCILLKYICLGECIVNIKKRPQSCTVVQICLIQPAVLNPYTLCMNRIFFPDMHIAHRHNQLNPCIHTTWLETRTRIYCKSIQVYRPIQMFIVYYKYKFNRPHGPCDMTNYTNKHYTMTQQVDLNI